MRWLTGATVSTIADRHAEDDGKESKPHKKAREHGEWRLFKATYFEYVDIDHLWCDYKATEKPLPGCGKEFDLDLVCKLKRR